MKVIFRTVIIALLSGMCSAHAEIWHCPSADEALSAFSTNQMAEWPSYNEGGAARVQRQYPETAIIASQAKYIDWGGRSAAICQYYTHIGLLAESVTLDIGRDSSAKVCSGEACGPQPYWRYEFVESMPEQDRPGREQLLVCMEERNGLAFPSIGCAFTISEPE